MKLHLYRYLKIFNIFINLMKKIICVFGLMLISTNSFSHQQENLNLSCDNFSWSDVEALVHPYLDATLYNALIMQGQSANYKTSAAATQAMDKSLPESVTKILQALILSDC